MTQLSSPQLKFVQLNSTQISSTQRHPTHGPNRIRLNMNSPLCFCFVCLILPRAIVRGAPTSTDELNTLMIQLHTDARNKVLTCQLAGQPQAKSMPDLIYDQGIADKAQTWADTCTVGHDTYDARKTATFPSVGQNFAGNGDFGSAFDAWFSENTNYMFDTNTCASTKSCGHYTQIVWAKTTHIGCAFKECPKTAQFRYGKSIVCNYGPAGNFNNEKPYVLGAQSICSPAKNTTTTAAIITATLNNISDSPHQEIWIQLNVICGFCVIELLRLL
ncbi:GLIPR1 protein 1 [Fasciola gigantica]|uniref:GLIPR1 protein 1 n=1 Tax=Fasciola gigantica TaxID=46835 RepID=A0A504Z3M3_FASGI|nr:GLIPR1 protein 1 [Fasciola gigantica]